MKIFKIVFMMLMTLVMVFSTVIPVSAESSPIKYEYLEAYSDIQPRLGHAGYVYYYHDGSSTSGVTEFEVSSIWFPYNEWTVKTSGFSSVAEITCTLISSEGRLVGSETMTGNQEIKNIDLYQTELKTGTYTLRIEVYQNGLVYDKSATGSIEVWVY